jgi:hypothetical protein
VPPAVVAGEQLVQLGQQVVVAAGAGLDQRDACGRVRHEDVQQSVGLLADELGALVGEVDDHRDTPGADGAQFRSHVH